MYFTLSILGTEYVYKYETQLSLKSGGGSEGVKWFESDDKLLDKTLFSSAADSFKITTNVKIANLWMGRENSLIRFKVRFLC